MNTFSILQMQDVKESKLTMSNNMNDRAVLYYLEIVWIDDGEEAMELITSCGLVV